MNPKKMIERMLGGSQQKLADVLESIHAHLEKQLEMQARILDLLEQKTGLVGRFKENEVYGKAETNVEIHSGCGEKRIEEGIDNSVVNR